MKKQLSIFYFLWLLLLLYPNMIFAKVMEAGELLNLILESNSNVTQAYFEVNVKVFDPEAQAPLSEKIEKNALSYELFERGFKQKILWIRDSLLAIESQSLDGTPLHIYFKVGENQYSENLTETRYFVDEDVIFHPILFFTKFNQVINTNLNDLGILNDRVQLEKQGFDIYYHLGDKNGFILFNPANANIEKIQFEILFGERYYPVSILMENWGDSAPTEKFPRTVKYFINDRLFKELHIDKILTYRLAGIKRDFIRQYQKRISDREFFNSKLPYENR